MKTITLPAGTLHLDIDDIADYMALSMWPLRDDGSPGDGLNYGFCYATLKAELAEAIESKKLPARNPLTLGMHDHPYGENVKHALVRVDDLRKYVADRGIDVEVDAPAQNPAQPSPGVSASDRPASQTTAQITESAWNLSRPTRFQGYGKPLYDFLKAAHVARKPIPKARDLLDAWKISPPLDVMEVTDNGLKYYDAQGNTKPADLEAIRKAIGRMAQKRPTTGR